MTDIYGEYPYLDELPHSQLCDCGRLGCPGDEVVEPWDDPNVDINEEVIR